MEADTEKDSIDEVEIEETSEEAKPDPESKYKTEDDSKEEKEVMKNAGCSKRPLRNSRGGRHEGGGRQLKYSKIFGDISFFYS